MANEIRSVVNVNVTNGLYKMQFSSSSQGDQAVQGAEEGIVIVGSGAEEDMPVGDVATNGVLLLYNLDSTNFVNYGPKSAGVMVPFGRINPGEVHKLRLAPSGVTLRWQANGANVKVQMSLQNN